jgi:hypothetical protein
LQGFLAFFAQGFCAFLAQGLQGFWACSGAAEVVTAANTIAARINGIFFIFLLSESN